MKTSDFRVHVRVKAIVSFGIQAETLEAAIVKARSELKDTQFIADGLEYEDGVEELVGVDADWGLE